MRNLLVLVWIGIWGKGVKFFGWFCVLEVFEMYIIVWRYIFLLDYGE